MISDVLGFYIEKLGYLSLGRPNGFSFFINIKKDFTFINFV